MGYCGYRIKKNRSKSTFNTRTEKYDFERLGLNLNCPIFQYFIFYNFKVLSCKWTMTRFIRFWNSPQGGSFNFRCPCKNLIRIQLIATNLSWLVYFASLMEETKDRYYLYHNAISREFRSRHESGAFVGKSIFSLWTLACQTKVISYAVSVTKWFYRQI